MDRLQQLAGLQIETVHPAVPAARWCVAQYFGELARRFETGFDPSTSLPADDDELVPEAILLYRGSGFEEVAPFNAESYADYWFEKKLV